MMGHIARLCARGLLVGVGVYVAMIAYMVLRSPDMIYHFEQSGDLGDPPAPFRVLEAEGFQGWYAQGDQDRSPVLVLVGNTARNSDGAKRAAALLKDGRGVLILSYPGALDEESAPSPDRMMNAAFAAYDWLSDEAGPAPAIYGISLGAAVATGVAAERDASSLVMEAPFTSVYDLARDMYPFIPPVDLLARNGWRSIDLMPGIEEPVLVLHGEIDRIIPVTHGRAIAAASDGARLIT